LLLLASYDQAPKATTGQAKEGGNRKRNK